MRRSLILDPAHGRDTPGKRSPDGLHLEYLWSRRRIARIVGKLLSSEKMPFDLFFPFLYHVEEPGLTTRGLRYNEIASNYDDTFVLSLHNDAEPPSKLDAKGWGKAHGTGVWTSRGEDGSDSIATSLFEFLKASYPSDKMRSAYWLNKGEHVRDPDYEADFTILAGNYKFKPKYKAVILEHGFQTNKKDVAKLINPIHNELFEDNLSEWLLTEF